MPAHLHCCLPDLKWASGVQVFTRSQAACGRQRSWTMLSPSWATAPASKEKITGSSSKLAVLQGMSVHVYSLLHENVLSSLGQ